MLENLPHNIISYLVEELPPYTGIMIFCTDDEGLIKDFHGPWKEYFSKIPEKEKQIHELIPALFSMIPPLVSPMMLNHIQLGQQKYVDIHIIGGDDNNYWVLMVNQNKAVDGIKEFIQKMNENKFLEQTQPSNISNHNNLLLEVFDFLCLEIIDDNQATIFEKKPNWFYLLKHDFNQTMNFTELFPYLEVFMIEAEEFFSTHTQGRIKSGIWTETFENGEEIALVAYALLQNDRKILLIHPSEDVINKEKMALQMAREQKLAYEKLQKAERKLKILLEYKDKFVSIVSHDLRSPVAAVLGISEMLINDIGEFNKLNDFYCDMIFNIRDEMTRLLDYNDKLYHWSNLELRNFSIEKENIDLFKLVKTAETTASKKLKEKQITFFTNIKKDTFIEADPTLMSQVLNNLIGNAIKFTPENGKISINICNKHGLQLSVIDTGMGMTEEKARDIFSGFTRQSSVGTQGEKGTGLGLGIVKKIIDNHNFSIEVKSKPGEGSEFIIKF